MKKKITALAMALVMVLGVAAVAAGGDKRLVALVRLRTTDLEFLLEAGQLNPASFK